MNFLNLLSMRNQYGVGLINRAWGSLSYPEACILPSTYCFSSSLYWLLKHKYILYERIGISSGNQKKTKSSLEFNFLYFPIMFKGGIVHFLYTRHIPWPAFLDKLSNCTFGIVSSTHSFVIHYMLHVRFRVLLSPLCIAAEATMRDFCNISLLMWLYYAMQII